VAALGDRDELLGPRETHGELLDEEQEPHRDDRERVGPAPHRTLVPGHERGETPRGDPAARSLPGRRIEAHRRTAAIASRARSRTSSAVCHHRATLLGAVARRTLASWACRKRTSRGSRSSACLVMYLVIPAARTGDLSVSCPSPWMRFVTSSRSTTP